MGTGFGKGKGSSLRELNNAIFDAMVSGKGGVTRVGMGASIYGFVGGWVPSGLVSWMMGMKKVGPQDGVPKHFKGLIENGGGSSSHSEGGSSDRATSPGGIAGLADLGESDYVYPQAPQDEYPEGFWGDGK